MGTWDNIIAQTCFYTLYQSGKCPARNTDRRAATVQLSVAVAVAHQSLVTHGTVQKTEAMRRDRPQRIGDKASGTQRRHTGSA